jgi:hypothetical protein
VVHGIHCEIPAAGLRSMTVDLPETYAIAIPSLT